MNYLILRSDAKRVFQTQAKITGFYKNRALFAAELEFPKMLVLRLPQHTSNVNTECAGKSKWSKLYIWPASWSTDTS